METVASQPIQKFTGIEIAEALGVSVSSTTRAMNDCMSRLAEHWMRNPEWTLMLILMFYEHWEQFYPKGTPPEKIPASEHPFLKAGKLARCNLVATFSMLMRFVEEKRKTRQAN